jgi:hypothetical protein
MAAPPTQSTASGSASDDRRTRAYETLDAILVVAALVIVAGLMAALVFVEIPTNNLPVLASLGATVVGLGTAYAAFRWSSNATAKNQADASASSAKTIEHLMTSGTGNGSGAPAPQAAPDLTNADSVGVPPQKDE